ncbi:MAG: methionyl-tRNA formyltransferase [Clostridium sp.]|nr:methionyl-tRNA formyltransferase [Clostridium sp.]MCM1398218.1 methionyl-tRNA formyltransferase [Clostridium sp.]MCM1460368.1 methionyl-tRNA formyltransferase [Bacteroides sp.]
MRVVYMGTPEFAVYALQAIIENGHDVIAVVTQPDKAKGRSKALLPTPVKAVAVEHNIPVYQPEKVRDEAMVNILKELAPEVIVVAAYGQILPESILNIPAYGCINIHASLLPKYRGAAPIEWAIINGEKVTGVTTMYMEKGLDTGDMIEKTEVEIEPCDTGKTLHDKLAVAGAELILSTLTALYGKTATRTKQNDEESCYASMLSKELGNIDFTRSAEEIERQIRGLFPWPCAYTKIMDKTVKLLEAQVVKQDVSDFQAGEIVNVTKKSFQIACGSDALLIKRLQPEGKKEMDAAAYLNGNKLEAGMIVSSGVNL